MRSGAAVSLSAAAARIRKTWPGAFLPLLSLMVFINYVDRGSLATAAPLLKPELHLSATQLGIILSAFFWSYTPSHLLAGWLADRWGPHKTLAVGVAAWSLATAGAGLAGDFKTLLLLRLLLGVGESAAFPCSSRLIAEGVAAHRLGLANGLLVIGTALGPAFGTFFGGLLIAGLGWRPVFIVLGLASLVWLAPWLALARGPTSSPVARERVAAAVRLGDVLRRRQLWMLTLGHFATNFAFYVIVSWLPVYLVKVHGYSMRGMAVIGGLIYLCYAAAALGLGMLSDRMISTGWSADLVRRAWGGIGLLLVAASLAACAASGSHLAIAALFVAAVGLGFTAPTLYAVAQTFAGARSVGVWVGVQNMLANVAGMIAPMATGLLIDQEGGFAQSFALCAALAFIGSLALTVGVGPVAPLRWQRDGVGAA